MPNTTTATTSTTDASKLQAIQRLHFPAKIYTILENESPEIIRWHLNNCAFRIFDHARFEAEIIPKYFRHNQLSSVQRQLNLYGFKCVNRGEDKGYFYHPKFQRGDWEAIKNIRRFNSATNPYLSKLPDVMEIDEKEIKREKEMFFANKSSNLMENESKEQMKSVIGNNPVSVSSDSDAIAAAIAAANAALVNFNNNHNNSNNQNTNNIKIKSESVNIANNNSNNNNNGNDFLQSMHNKYQPAAQLVNSRTNYHKIALEMAKHNNHKKIAIISNNNNINNKGHSFIGNYGNNNNNNSNNMNANNTNNYNSNNNSYFNNMNYNYSNNTTTINNMGVSLDTTCKNSVAIMPMMSPMTYPTNNNNCNNNVNIINYNYCDMSSLTHVTTNNNNNNNHNMNNFNNNNCPIFGTNGLSVPSMGFMASMVPSSCDQGDLGGDLLVDSDESMEDFALFCSAFKDEHFVLMA